MDGFSIYKIFPSLAEANELIAILEENKIQFSLVDNSHDVDITFTGNNSQSNLQLFLA